MTSKDNIDWNDKALVEHVKNTFSGLYVYQISEKRDLLEKYADYLKDYSVFGAIKNLDSDGEEYLSTLRFSAGLGTKIKLKNKIEYEFLQVKCAGT